MPKKITLEYYSDVLCIWAYIAQARINEIERHFGEQVEVSYRICTVFADTRHKMETLWQPRGGYEGFAAHLEKVAEPYDHITINAAIWRQCRPLSSTPAHLTLKAVQELAPEKLEDCLLALRRGFFERALDIGNADVLEQILEEEQLPMDDVRALFRSGMAHALLEADLRQKEQQNISGSPTYVLNEGRQKLYGNVGYGVIEANIKELLKSPDAGKASWC